MNKNLIDFKQVKKLVRKALRQQAVNKLHLMLLNVTDVKDSYVKSHEGTSSSLRFFLPPLFLILFIWHLIDILIDSFLCFLESVSPWVHLDVFRENVSQIAYCSGLIDVYVVVVVSEDGLRYNSACDIDHFEDLWDGHHD